MEAKTIPAVENGYNINNCACDRCLIAKGPLCYWS